MSTGEKWRLIFGFALLIELGVLAAVIGLGKVHQESSFGLDFILGGLTSLAGGFTQWAFTHSRAAAADKAEMPEHAETPERA